MITAAAVAGLGCGNPVPTDAEQAKVAEILNKVDGTCDGRREPVPPRFGLEDVRQLGRIEDRAPDGEFQLDSSSPPTTMQIVLKDLVVRYFDTPCRRVAVAAKREIQR